MPPSWKIKYILLISEYSSTRTCLYSFLDIALIWGNTLHRKICEKGLHQTTWTSSTQFNFATVILPWGLMKELSWSELCYVVLFHTDGVQLTLLYIAFDKIKSKRHARGKIKKYNMATIYRIANLLFVSCAWDLNKKIICVIHVA